MSNQQAANSNRHVATLEARASCPQSMLGAQASCLHLFSLERGGPRPHLLLGNAEALVRIFTLKA
ncbi:MAG: hypothetical protein M3R52_10965 [Acidobacteriota bacterium]|nr:hypothetical protein [Acidobacteriota bacterium]